MVYLENEEVSGKILNWYKICCVWYLLIVRGNLSICISYGKINYYLFIIFYACQYGLTFLTKIAGYHLQTQKILTHRFYWMAILIVILVPLVLLTVVHVLVGTMKTHTCLVATLAWFTHIFIITSLFFFLVASMLELARLTVDSGWVPPRPIIFLFNGAEELFMLVRHSGSALSWRITRK